MVATITVNAVNDAPVLDNTKSPALTAQNEDAGAPSGAVGTLVSSLVDFASPAGQVDNVTDVDSGALLGIAVTAADTANGTWYYSTNNGANWNALGAVASNNARLLAADANTRLYFQPNANYNGTLASAITFRAWDQTSGSNGTLADTTSNGGTTAFSTATDTASLVINPVADTPSVTNATTNEDTQTTSGLVISRNVADGAEVTHFKITGITNGTLYQNDGTTQITNGTFITFAEGNAGLKFTPTANFNGSGSFTVQASTSNGDAGLGGSTVNATITVNPVADTPSVTNATTNEDTQTTSGLVISRNAADGAEVTHFKITGITNGTLYKNDGTTPITNGTFITFAEGQRRAEVHADGQFQRQRQLHGPGLDLQRRRRPGRQHGDRHDHRQRGQRRAGAGQREPRGVGGRDRDLVGRQLRHQRPGQRQLHLHGQRGERRLLPAQQRAGGIHRHLHKREP